MKNNIFMFFGLFLGVFSLTIHSLAGWDDTSFQPKIEIKYEVILSTGMKVALTKYDPEFQIWKAEDFHPMVRELYTFTHSHPWRSFLAYQTLSAVIGDFNGDKIPDIALMGHNKTHRKRIVILSKNGKYHVVEFFKHLLINPMTPNHKIGGGNIQVYLELIAPGKINANPDFKRPEIDLKTDAFKVCFFETASSLYYYSNGKFISYALSD